MLDKLAFCKLACETRLATGVLATRTALPVASLAVTPGTPTGVCQWEAGKSRLSGTNSVNRTVRGRKETLSTHAHVFDSSYDFLPDDERLYGATRAYALDKLEAEGEAPEMRRRLSRLECALDGRAARPGLARGVGAGASPPLLARTGRTPRVGLHACDGIAVPGATP